jgi:hypothetical protein
MSMQTRRTARRANAIDGSAIVRAAGLARAGRALRLAGALLNFGSQFVPLGDNRALLADLAARVSAARDVGA